MKRLFLSLACTLCAALCASPARSFCGFYVAAGDAKLFNHSSRVVLVRDGDRTVITMANDFHGEPREFALVVPVPTVLEQGQIHVGDAKLVDHLDAYTAPRLVEYFDGDPCMVAKEMNYLRLSAPAAADAMRDQAAAKSLGVTIEARYTVGEYDILILSATQSSGLETWLHANGYRVPEGAARVLHAYILQGLKFFVARVNLSEQQKLGFRYLRPLQIAYESPRFMLPIRLGMANADGPQELFVYALTRSGRVETTNYRTVRLPSDQDVPEFVKDAFPDFYRALFDRAVRNEDGRAVFTEYAWDMGWCDPCAADPLSADELRELGAFWLADAAGNGGRGASPGTFVTRLHLRYDRATFPEDLVLQVTADRANFQARYVLHHPWKGAGDCPAAQAYRVSLRARREREARNLSTLTGWDLAGIREKMQVAADWSAASDSSRWWQAMWR